MTDAPLAPDSTKPAARARISLWGGAPWADPARREEAREAAREVEAFGYARIWLSGGFDPGLHPVFGELLDATEEIGVASGIVSIFAATPEQAREGAGELERRHPGRFLLGLGNSHAAIVERSGEDYSRPYSRTVEYLDALDAAGDLPRERRALAALGPRMLRLARDRSLGAHPYFTTPAHTSSAREVLGEGVLLAPEVAVVHESDPVRARRIARRYATGYLALPNYTNNLRRFGYGDEDFADGGSDRLVDELIPWGDTATVVAGIARHVDAGADEVAVQVLTDSGDEFPLRSWRELAQALIG